MILQPFVGPWPFFQFRNSIHSRYDSLNVGSANRKAATYTQNKRTPRVGFELNIPVSKRAKRVYASDRAATVISSGYKYLLQL
jgi:hypothetical protein